MFPFELTRPWALLTLVPMALVVGYYFRYSLSDFPRTQRMVSAVIRFVILLLLALASLLGLGGAFLLKRWKDAKFSLPLFLLGRSPLPTAPHLELGSSPRMCCP